MFNQQKIKSFKYTHIEDDFISTHLIKSIL